jgi:hypothetical protein
MEDRRRGIIRVHIDSLVRLICGKDYTPIAMRISRENHQMLEITVSHPHLPEWKRGSKIQIIRRYEQEKAPPTE